MSNVRRLPPIARSERPNTHALEMHARDLPSAPSVRGDRIDRAARDATAGPTPYVSIGVDVGFLLGLQASLTLAGGRFYGSIGEFSGLVPGVGASLGAGVVRPHRGESLDSTLEGTGFTAAAGFGFGAQASVSNAGATIGGSLTTPSAGVGVTRTHRLLPW